MPAHTVDTTIMRILYILTDGLTSGICHLDAPALHHACIHCNHTSTLWRQDKAPEPSDYHMNSVACGSLHKGIELRSNHSVCIACIVNHAEQRAGFWTRVLCSHVVTTGSKGAVVPPANTFDSTNMLLLVALDNRDGSSSI